MVVQTREEAWEVAKKMSEVEYYKNELDSYYAGYPIYKNDINIQVADLGVRLEVKTDNYKITNIWIAEQIGEGITQEMEQEAEKISDNIVLKPLNIKIGAKAFDKNTIFQIAAQTLKKAKTANSTAELLDMCDEAEDLLKESIKKCDACLTIYQPLHTVMDKWQKEGKLVRRNYTFIGESEQKTELEIEKKMNMIEEQYSIIANDFEKYVEDMREEGALACTMSEQEINQSFAMMQFMSMTRDFMKKGIEIINELSKGMRGKE